MASESLTLAPLRAAPRRWFVSPAALALAVVTPLAVVLAWPHPPDVLRLLWLWLPYFLEAFLLNILISVVAIGLGTLAGLFLAAAELSSFRLLRFAAAAFVGVFRNAPLLVLVFAASFALPFEIKVFGVYLQFPDWVKAAAALTLPAAAHIAEIFRGAIQSIPSAQWESATSLAFNRSQSLRWIILPQCIKRALPPWMNLYSTITMGTSLASLAGVDDLLHAANNASQAVHSTDFTIAVFPLVLLCFFLYCYPISRLTSRLERRFAVQ
jgi:polar amino acid transport system permease protein